MRRPAAVASLLLLVGLVVLGSPPSRAAVAKPAFTTVLLAGSNGRSEPRATITATGQHFVTTNDKSGEEVVFRSTDGLRWKQVTVPGGQTSPTTDVDVVSTTTGRILTSELDFAGINFVTSYSDNLGKTWVRSKLTTFADTDRQWYATGPADPKTGKPRVYMLFHNLLSGTVQHNMFVSTSTDGGVSFGAPIPVAIPPQQDYLDLQCADSGGPSNIFVNQKTGKVYVVFGTRSSPVGGCAAQPTEVNVVAANRVWVVSAPASKTATPGGWTPSLAVNDSNVGKITGMQLAPGTIDDAGNLYVAYPESVHDYPDYDGAAIKVVHSTNDGKSWSAPLTIAPSGGPGNLLPLIVAGDAGKIDVSWYHGLAKGAWRAYNAQVLDALSPRPAISTSALTAVQVEQGDASTLMGACLQGTTATLNGFACDRATDVNGIAEDTCGRVLVTYPAQAGLKTDGTYVSEQVGGPRLRSVACSQAITPPTVITPPGAAPPHAAPPHRASGAGHALASTGASAGLAAVALLLIGMAFATRRRSRI